MFTFLVLLTGVIFIALLVVAGIRLESSPFGLLELERRAKKSPTARVQLHRQEALSSITALLSISRALLLVTTILLTVVTFGWIIGTIIAVCIALFYHRLADTKAVRHIGQKLYTKLESHLIAFVTRYDSVFRFFQGTSFGGSGSVAQFGSREELQELIAASKEALTHDERLLISAALSFPEKKVSSIMTPRTVIKYIKKSEFLGPLVLSELHTLGHSRLPVIDEDLNHVVGILYLRDLLSLNTKRSTTAEKAMERKVFYIHENDSLRKALAAFLKNRHHLFIVINDQRETVGLVSLEDVMEQLLGQRIIDEDDVHEDLRIVAKREGVKNNTPSDHVDV